MSVLGALSCFSSFFFKLYTLIHYYTHKQSNLKRKTKTTIQNINLSIKKLHTHTITHTRNVEL